jgi:hypothetical protein
MPQNETSARPAHPLIESSSVEGTSVYDANGKQIGTIKRLVIEKVSGHVIYAVTAFGGFLGPGRRDPYDPMGATALRPGSPWLQDQHHGRSAAECTRVLAPRRRTPVGP